MTAIQSPCRRECYGQQRRSGKPVDPLRGGAARAASRQGRWADTGSAREGWRSLRAEQADQIAQVLEQCAGAADLRLAGEPYDVLWTSEHLDARVAEQV